MLGFKTFQQLAHVAGGAFVVIVAPAASVKVGVKRRNLDHPEAHRFAFMVDLQGVAFGGPVFQFDLVANDRNHSRLGASQGFRFDDLQIDHRAFFPADQLYHVIDAPTHHVHDLTIQSLAHPDDLVIGMQLLAFISRTAGHDFTDDGIIVLRGQAGADAFQRLAHLNPEIVEIFRRKVAGVRIVGFGEGIHQNLEYVFALELLDIAFGPLIALGQGLADARPVFSGQLEVQCLIFDPLAPQFIQFGRRLGPGIVFPVDVDRLINRKIERFAFQQCEDMHQPFRHTFFIKIEDIIGGLHLPGTDIIVEHIAVLLERLNVRFQKIEALIIQLFQVTVEGFRAQGIIKRLTLVVGLPQQMGHHLAHLAVLRFGTQRLKIDGCRFGPGKNQGIYQYPKRDETQKESFFH